MTYASVRGGRVVAIAEETRECPLDAYWADVTGLDPAPQIGWVLAADGVTLVAPVPASVTNFQARAVLMSMPSPTEQAGRTLFQDVDDALHAEGGVALQAWEYANDVTRQGALVNSLGARLGMTAAQLDALFVAAAALVA